MEKLGPSSSIPGGQAGNRQRLIAQAAYSMAMRNVWVGAAIADTLRFQCPFPFLPFRQRHFAYLGTPASLSVTAPLYPTGPAEGGGGGGGAGERSGRAGAGAEREADKARPSRARASASASAPEAVRLSGIAQDSRGRLLPTINTGILPSYREERPLVLRNRRHAKNEQAPGRHSQNICVRPS